MTLKNTKQRAIILEVIMASKEHLTAEQIYSKLKDEDYSIGLATVYRNLNVLYQTHQINRVLHQESGYVYDGNTHQHYHFKCSECGAIVDVEMPYQESLDELAKVFSEENEIDSHTIVFNGICQSCLKKNKKENKS